jgi:hypothetical protein
MSYSLKTCSNAVYYIIIENFEKAFGEYRLTVR